MEELVDLHFLVDRLGYIEKARSNEGFFCFQPYLPETFPKFKTLEKLEFGNSLYFQII